MDNKQPTDQPDQNQLDKALLQFDNQTPLNLTNQQKQQQDPEMSAKIEEEYAKFMNQMKNSNFGNFQSEEGLQGLTSALGGLLKGLTEELGVQGKEGDELKNIFEGGGNDMQSLAGKLLQVFMKKDLLYEPLLESKTNYQNYFKNNEGKIKEEDLKRYRSQYETIREILGVFDNNPNDKTTLMNLFEKMQDYGQAPQGIVSVSLPTM